MKDLEKGSAAMASVVCRVIDYYVAKQAQAVAVENGFTGTEEMRHSIEVCEDAEIRIVDAIANIAIQVMK